MAIPKDLWTKVNAAILSLLSGLAVYAVQLLSDVQQDIAGLRIHQEHDGEEIARLRVEIAAAEVKIHELALENQETRATCVRLWEAFKNWKE